MKGYTLISKQIVLLALLCPAIEQSQEEFPLPEPEPIAFGEGPPALFDYANDWNPLVDLT